MTAIFTTQQAAQQYADDVQSHLEAHRPGYSAQLWEVPQKHPTLDKWAVVCPPEDVPCTGSKTELLSDDWYPPVAMP